MWVLVDMPANRPREVGNPDRRSAAPPISAAPGSCEDLATNVLVVVGDQPYGSEPPYNVLRPAKA